MYLRASNEAITSRLTLFVFCLLSRIFWFFPFYICLWTKLAHFINIQYLFTHYSCPFLQIPSQNSEILIASIFLESTQCSDRAVAGVTSWGGYPVHAGGAGRGTKVTSVSDPAPPPLLCLAPAAGSCRLREDYCRRFWIIMATATPISSPCGALWMDIRIQIRIKKVLSEGNKH